MSSDAPLLHRDDPDREPRLGHINVTRISAVTQMYREHGYTPTDADARARSLYFMQLGYHALDVRETIDMRLSRVAPYLEGFTGQPADPDDLGDFMQRVRQMNLS